MLSFGRFTLLVRDYDEALAFYRDVLGFEVLHDSIGEGGQRFLHIGNASQGGMSGLGLWLLKPGSDVDRSLIGRQSGRQPFIVLYTPDCSAEVNVLETRGVKIRHAPKSDGGAVYAHFEDLYGNEIVMVELAGAGT